jgi:predicted kinase
MAEFGQRVRVLRVEGDLMYLKMWGCRIVHHDRVARRLLSVARHNGLMQPEPPAVVVITGLMAAGKSTIAQLLAEQLPRSAHVRGDSFRRMVVGGRVEVTEPATAEATAQLHLRYELSARTADAYAAAGFVAVVQDVILAEDVEPYLASLATAQRYLIVLAPRTDVVERRERARNKTGYGKDWTPDSLAPYLWRDTPHIGLWIDTSEQTPEDTVAELLARLSEARIN